MEDYKLNIKWTSNNTEIILEELLVSEGKPMDSNMPRDIISIVHFKINNPYLDFVLQRENKKHLPQTTKIYT